MKGQRQTRDCGKPLALLQQRRVSAHAGSDKWRGWDRHAKKAPSQYETVSKHIFLTALLRRKRPVQLAMITKFIINCVFHDVSDNMLM